MTSGTFCVMPHRRIRVAGEVIGTHTEIMEDEEGEPTEIEFIDYSKGGEIVYDHEGKPRPGSHDGSLLCRGHLNRLRELIAETPETISWIRAQLEPAAGAGGEGKPPKRMESKMPISAAAVDDADDILGMLFTWAQLGAEELRRPPPATDGTWKIVASRWTNDGDMRVQGISSNSRWGSPVDTVTRWMLANLDPVACLPWVGEMLSEIAEQRGRILGRYPLQDRARTIENVQCPRCEKCTIVMYAPSHEPQWIVEPYLDAHGQQVGLVWQGNPFGDGAHCRLDRHRQPIVATVRRLEYAAPVLVQCSDPHCGEMIPEQDWRKIVAELENQRRDEKRRKRSA